MPSINSHRTKYPLQGVAEVEDQATSQRKEADEILALLGRKAINSQQDFVDSLADGHKIADQKYTGHRLSGTHSIVGEARHGVAIVGEQNSPLDPRGDGDTARAGCHRRSSHR